MATHRLPLNDATHIPMRHESWYIQMLLLLAAVVLAGMVYSFYRMSQAPSPVLDLPAGALEPQPAPAPASPAAP